MTEARSADIERRLQEEVEKIVCRPIGRPTKTWRSVTDEPYVCLCGGGVKAEGQPWPRLYDTPESAAASFLSAVIKYSVRLWNEDVGGKLYWRWPPEVVSVDGKWQVWARLLISDKPEQVAA